MLEKFYSPELNTLSLKINSSAHVVLDDTWHSENVRDPITRLYYISDGEGFLKSNGQTVKLSPKNVYMIPSGVEFSYGCTALEKLYFHVYLSGVEKFDLLSAVGGICHMPFSDADYKKLSALYRSDNYIDLLEVQLILTKTITDFFKLRSLPEIPIKRYSDTVIRTMRYIRDNLRINLTLEEISNALFISGSKIRKNFKDETGITVGRYIDDMIFTTARRLLENDELSISDISEGLGFCDRFYFSRRFRKLYNKTPTQYRREIRGQQN